eukprot:gb/GECH01001129.1/.p1 GENE.gb/GECH01001129.1/~~gb/GECH01001129.1/.p1  ORF type:complete len:359 (+),score=85.00 gb/GECH01001129.1/:1-1077(+)
MSSSPPSSLQKEKHIAFFKYHLRLLPEPYAKLDVNRMTAVFFILNALDVLGVLHTDVLADDTRRQEIIDWVYSQQVVTNKEENNNNNIDIDDEPSLKDRAGFIGGPFLGVPFNPQATPRSLVCRYDGGHIAMTYTALALLKMLGDDFSRVDKKAILETLGELQNANGSFKATAVGSENDMRFTYCAMVICYLLDDFSTIDVDRAIEYIFNSQSYDSAFAQEPGQEGHGGSTFCAVASLSLLHRLPMLDDSHLIEWLVQRHLGGFQGRPHKDPDTCYSYWIGCTLKTLDALSLIDVEASRQFTYTCQANTGGVSKCPGVFADIMHSSLSLCGLSLIGEEGLQPIDPAIGITKRALGTEE